MDQASSWFYQICVQKRPNTYFVSYFKIIKIIWMLCIFLSIALTTHSLMCIQTNTIPHVSIGTCSDAFKCVTTDGKADYNFDQNCNSWFLSDNLSTNNLLPHCFLTQIIFPNKEDICNELRLTSLLGLEPFCYFIVMWRSNMRFITISYST